MKGQNWLLVLCNGVLTKTRSGVALLPGDLVFAFDCSSTTGH